MGAGLAESADRAYSRTSDGFLTMRFKLLITALLALALAVPAAASAQALPDQRTHTDAAADIDPGAAPAGATDDDDAEDAPRLTLLKSATTAKLVKEGYLAVRARCNMKCSVTVVATAKIKGKKREIGTTTKKLPANKIRVIKIKIRSDVRREIQAGRGFSFEGTPSIIF